MKKIKLGKLDVQALSERELKNVLGGVGSPASTVTTKSTSSPTQTKGTSDSDYGGTDTDSSAIIIEEIK